MKKLELVIFDMDGVLIDSEKFYMKSEQQVIQTYGQSVELDFFRKYCGMTQDNIWQGIKDDFDLPDSIATLKEKGKESLAYLFKTECVALIPGVFEIIRELNQSNFKIAVASSTSRVLIEEHLSQHHILDHFDFVKSGEEVLHSKPAPDVFLATANELNVPIENCLVIEDSPNGIKAAKRAGMVCIGFNNPLYDTVNQEEADVIISDMALLTDSFLRETFESH